MKKEAAAAAKKAPKRKAAKKEPAKSDAKEEPQDEPVEESDFGKARRALVTADTGKKKAVKQHKVDFGWSGLAVGAWAVVEDWDCTLNQTNIGHNNNKYYIIQLLQTVPVIKL